MTGILLLTRISTAQVIPEVWELRQFDGREQREYGRYWCVNKATSTRACVTRQDRDWLWSHTVDKDGTPFLLKELEQCRQYLPETQWYLLAATVNKCLDVAAKGEFKFNPGNASDEKLRGPTVSGTGPRVGPVKRMLGTKAVFEISQDVRDWEGRGDSYRYFRIYFSEPPLDSGAELLSLRISSKPIDGHDLQNDDAHISQDRYDDWSERQAG
ncbi:MAG: hypothetical protein LKI28_03650 [Ancrocorticia sp.]|nr:hypothetical protein [Ancrocorticia sp.]MCI2178710.1 hypothetical protein [Ancrocorticia sp.]